jgi:O-6-methylguanine DNA methyltransferase
MIIKLSKDPKVRITLEFEAFQFKRASLSFADCFECCIQGNSEKKNRDPLLRFLESYSKKNPLSIELNLEHLSPFRKKAFDCLQKIPFGEVLTYGKLSDKIGHPRAARAIGTACHHNLYPLFIPCHRVIASGKRLGGFATDLRMKKELLDFEEVLLNANFG